LVQLSKNVKRKRDGEKKMETRNCTICETKIEVKRKYIGRERKVHIVSKQGTMFGRNWFCNGCVKQVLEGKK